MRWHNSPSTIIGRLSITQTGTRLRTSPFDGVDLHDVENERLAGGNGQPADPGPLAIAVLLHDDIRENPERAVDWFGDAESLVAPSIRHVV
jgi:hypothetical protein